MILGNRTIRRENRNLRAIDERCNILETITRVKNYAIRGLARNKILAEKVAKPVAPSSQLLRKKID